MTRAEAEAYTKDSYYAGRTFYHGTDSASAQDIANTGIDVRKLDPDNTYGTGFYVSRQEDVSRDYALGKANPRLVLLYLKVKKPKIFSFGTDFYDAGDELGFAPGSEGWPSNFVTHLKNQGYDAIEVINLDYVCVFEPEQVVTYSIQEIIHD